MANEGSRKAQQIVDEIRKAVVGKDDVIQKLLMAILADGHVLMDDIPGVGKTTMALAFSKALDLDYKRTQFTPDVLPTDVTGFSIYDKDTGDFKFMPGAAMCNLYLADEINRTSSKTQSALLEVMAEGQITVDGVTRQMPKPYTVIATQNPMGSIGTQMLPESQLDRFLICVNMGYPDLKSEVEILRARHDINPLDDVHGVVTSEELLAMQEEVRQIFVDDAVYEYIAKLSDATRRNSLIDLGLSPRGSLAITRLTKAAAYLNGRDFCIPDDVQDVFLDAARHRIVLNPKARVSGTTAEHIARDILAEVPMPTINHTGQD